MLIHITLSLRRRRSTVSSPLITSIRHRLPITGRKPPRLLLLLLLWRVLLHNPHVHHMRWQPLHHSRVYVSPTRSHRLLHITWRRHHLLMPITSGMPWGIHLLWLAIPHARSPCILPSTLLLLLL